MKNFIDKANEILEKGIDTAKKGYQVASKKFSEIEEETKTRLNIVEKEKEIDKLFKELGQRAYKSYLNSDAEEDITLMCKQIDKVISEKDNLEKNVLKLKDLMTCENCNHTIDIGCSFCPYCGYIQENKEKNIEVDVKKEEKEEKEEVKKAAKKTVKKEEPKAENKVATIKLKPQAPKKEVVKKVVEEKEPVKKTAAKKEPAKKAVAKKETAKKATTKKDTSDKK